MLTGATLSGKILSMARPRSIEIDPSTLEQLYITDGLSLAEVALRMGVSAESIRHRLVECGITRHLSQRRFAVDIPVEELRRMYDVEKLGMKDIANRLGATYNGVRNAIVRAGIETENPGRQRRGPYQNRRHYSRITTNGRGYPAEYVPDHPRAKKRGWYVSTHMLVVEKAIGRYLVDSEVVHHINLCKTDYRVENLAILDNHWHAKVHEYMEHLGVYLCGLTPLRPEPLDFGAPVFWGGKYVTCIDLLQGARFASGEPLLGETSLDKPTTERVN